MADGTGGRTRRASGTALALFAVASLAGGLILLPGGVLRAGILVLSQTEQWVRAHEAAMLLGLFVVSAVLQLLLLPVGTMLMLLGGYLLGLPAAGAYFAGMVVAGQVVHAAARRAGVDMRANRAMVERLAEFQTLALRNGFLTVVALRLAPVLPSAAAAGLAAALDIPARTLFWGTIASGWIRPLACAAIGASAASFGAIAAGRVDTRPLVTIGLLALVPAGMLAWRFIATRLARPGAGQ